MIQVERLRKEFGRFAAVDDLSFTVSPGEILGLVGPNGAGKTTTLRCIVGIVPPTRGDVLVCGRSIVRDPVEAKRGLAFMPDEPRLFDYLSVEEHLRFTARIYSLPDVETRLGPLLDEMELSDKRDALPAELSRGMKQKLMIACGLLHAPRVLLLDEPLTGLDPIGIRRMKSIILRRAHEGAAVLLSSHLLHLVEEICDRVLILKAGRKIAEGSLEEILKSHPTLAADANLEDVFLRVTGNDEAGLVTQ